MTRFKESDSSKLLLSFLFLLPLCRYEVALYCVYVPTTIPRYFVCVIIKPYHQFYITRTKVYTQQHTLKNSPQQLHRYQISLTVLLTILEISIKRFFTIASNNNIRKWELLLSLHCVLLPKMILMPKHKAPSVFSCLQECLKQ